MTDPVNTKQAVRRQLRFESLDDIIADAEVLAHHGYEQHGNWSLGRVCDHLSRAMHASIEGIDFKVPLHFRLLGRLMRPWMLWRGFPAGLPLYGGAAKAMLPAEAVSDEEGLESLHRAVRRLRLEAGREPSPVLGRMTTAQWDRFHCRHAELHLGFLSPKQSSKLSSKLSSKESGAPPSAA